MKVAACTCGAKGAEYGDPHRDGCPRYRDRSKAVLVVAALRRRYNDSEGEWLLYEEAWGIDAFAMRCWTSGIGHRRIAFEVKTSRADFLAEIRKPSKRATALELSHCYFFATPKGLVQPHEIPAECGLIEIDAKGRTKIAVKAPVRQPRALRMSEAIYLARKPLYRGGILQLRRELLSAEAQARWAREREADARDRLERVHERIEQLNGSLVTVGSLWKGLWAPHSWMKASDGVECYVEEVRGEDGGYVRVKLRRLDSGETWDFVSRAELLERFEPMIAP